jgi:hypothetical protein
MSLNLRIREETAMSLIGFPKRSPMGTWSYVSRLLNKQLQMHPQVQEVPPPRQLSGVA